MGKKLALTILTVCAVSPALAQQVCLEQNAVIKMKNTMETLIDKLPSSSQPPFTSQLVRENCYKQVYHRSDYNFILFKDPTDPEQHISAEVSNAANSNADLNRCWQQAETLIANFGPGNWASNELRFFASKFPWRQNDLDLGPVKFLKCGGNDRDLKMSFDMMLHETTHLLVKDQCLFQSSTGNTVCFSLGADLPLRGIARYAGVPQEIAVFYDPIQKLYMDTGNDKPLRLFDELNAYTVSLKTQIELAKNFGMATLFDSNGNRPILNLPLFLFYAENYLEHLKKSDPVLYQRYFAEGGVNLLNLRRLETEGESLLFEFKAMLEKNQMTLHPAEIYFYQKYLNK